jgi:hypothetical protein
MLLASVFRLTVSALTHSIIRERCGYQGEGDDPPHERVVRFVLAQHARMPDYLRLPIMCLTVAFGVSAIVHTGRPFHRLSHDRRWRMLRAWSRSRLALRRDLVKFFENLTLYEWFAQDREP